MSRYKPYPKYKESGVEWLGEVPEYWEKYRIDWITTIIRGNTGFKKDELLNKGDFVALQYGKTYKVDEINDSFNFYVNSEFFKSNQVVHQGDTILVSTSETIEDLGHSCFYNRKELGLIGGEQILLKPYNKLLFGKYLYYYSRVFCNELRKYATGLKVFRFSTDDLKNIFVSSPPLEEQTTIANFLDRETAKIDMLIAKQERLIELLQEKRQALISHAVTKGLDPNAKMKESGVAWLGEVPEHWEVTKMKYVIHRIESGTSVNASDTPASNEEIGVLKTSCVYTGKFDPSQNKTVFKAEVSRVSCQLKENTLIVSRMNTPDLVGAAGFVEYAPCNIYLPDRLWQVIFRSVVPVFVHYLTLTGIYRGYIQTVCEGTSSSMQNLAQEDFRNFIFALPDQDEQEQIADYLDTQTNKIDTLIEKAKQAITLLKERRTALISAAVTGKIQVNDEVREETLVGCDVREKG